MKFFKATALVGLLASASATIDCGEGRVVSHSKICIQPNYIEGCLTYASSNECHQCENEYQLKDYKCSYMGDSGLAHNPGCLTKDAQGKCTNCANGYVRSNGTCKVGVKDCLVLTDSGVCTECSPDFSLVLGMCRHNLLLGCRTEEQDHTCKECFEPFRMVGNHCSIENCKTFNDYGCTNCECGYYLTSDRNCREIEPGCLRYQRGKCINCISHYKLKGGACQIDGCKDYSGNSCEKCDDNYEKTSAGGCKFKNCYDWLNGECLVCESGFRKEGSECVKLTEEELQCA